LDDLVIISLLKKPCDGLSSRQKAMQKVVEDTIEDVVGEYLKYKIIIY